MSSKRRGERLGQSIWSGWHRKMLMIVLSLVLFLAACSQGEDSSFGVESGVEEQSASGVQSSDAATEEAEIVDGSGDGDPDVVRAPNQTGRLVRREASVSLEVEDLTAGIDEVSDLIIDDSAYLAAEQTNERASVLTFKVPSDDFDQALEGLPELGKLRSQQVVSDDRTDVIVDLRSQLETAETSLERTRGFFEQATTVEDLTQIEAEVAQREATVAAIKAQLQNEEDSVALSTIVVELFLADDQPVELDEDEDAGILDALSAGFSALTAVLYTIFLVIAWLVPWMPIIVAVFFGFRWLRRRVAKRRAQRPKRVAPHPQQPVMPQQMGVHQFPNQPNQPNPPPTAAMPEAPAVEEETQPDGSDKE